MFYIVRVWESGNICEYHYDRQEDAEAQMQQATEHAEMFVWLAGREWFMSSVN